MGNLSGESYRGLTYFLHFLEIGTIIPFKTVIIVEGQGRYLVNGDGNLIPEKVGQIHFQPADIFDFEKIWQIEKEKI